MEIDTSSEISNTDMETIDLNNSEHIVECIKHNRNRPRSNVLPYIGSMAFDIVWQDGTESREPLQNLIDTNSKIINYHVIEFINDYKNTAIKYPTVNRNCLFCYEKVFNGRIICNNHHIYSFILD